MLKEINSEKAIARLIEVFTDKKENIQHKGGGRQLTSPRFGNDIALSVKRL